MTFKDVCAQTDLALTESYNNPIGFYFVVSHTDNGTRFYSDPIANIEVAEETFGNYVDVIKYFEGGTVELYKILPDDYDVIAFVRI